MVYRKGELQKSQIDRDWPHQVAFPVEFVKGKDCIIIDRFCRGLSVCPRHQHYWRDGVEHIAYCFKELLDADYLRTHFEGELVDPTNLGPWSRVMSTGRSTRSQPICSNVITMTTDKKTRDALRKVREAIERVAPGVLAKAESDVDKETAAIVATIEQLQPKGGKSELATTRSRPFNALDCPVCHGQLVVESRLPGRTKTCPRCLGRGWIRAPA